MSRHERELSLAASLASHASGVGVTTLSRAVLKRDRMLPVAPGVAAALRAVGLSGGLPRGSVCCITGPFRVSCTIASLARASASGPWVAWCSSSAPNCRALVDAGWYLERFVWVDPAARWAECMGAAIGQFEIVVTQLPRGVPARDVTHVSAVARRRDGVLVVLADHLHASLSADIVFDAGDSEWSTAGSGFLASQEMSVTLRGRRVAQPHVFSLMLGGS